MSSFSCLPKLLLLLKLLISALISNRLQLRAFDCSPKSLLCFFLFEQENEKAFEAQSLFISGDYKVNRPQISFQPASEGPVSISSF